MPVPSRIQSEPRSLIFTRITYYSATPKKKELDLLAARFERLALKKPLPPNAIKPIKGRPAEDDWEEFELRNKSLRVYLFIKPPNGNIIVMGEYKKGARDQRKTIHEFQKLKQAFKAEYLIAKSEEE